MEAASAIKEDDFVQLLVVPSAREYHEATHATTLVHAHRCQTDECDAGHGASCDGHVSQEIALASAHTSVILTMALAAPVQDGRATHCVYLTSKDECPSL